MARPNNRFRCGGVTLIELLVVFSILSILAGLLIPAVQASREAVRSLQCKSNLRQLGTAAILHQSANGRLPPGYLGPVPARSVTSGMVISERDHQLVGLLPYLLPYIEYKYVYEKIGSDMLDARSDPSFQLWLLNDDTWDAANHPVDAFACPSANQGPPSKGILPFLNPYYHEDDGVLVLESAPIIPKFSSRLGTTNYLGNSGYFGSLGVAGLEEVDEWRGPFGTRSHTRPVEIKDGTSKTLLLGEAIGAMNQGKLMFAYSWMGCGAMPLAMGIGDVRSWSNFSSEHAGRVGFCFADGSVRFLDIDISEEVLMALGGIRDGQGSEHPVNPGRPND